VYYLFSNGDETIIKYKNPGQIIGRDILLIKLLID